MKRIEIETLRKIATACALAAMMPGCGTALTKAAANGTQTAASQTDSSATSSSSSGGSVNLTEPTASASGATKIHITITDPTKCSTGSAGTSDSMPPKMAAFFGGMGQGDPGHHRPFMAGDNHGNMDMGNGNIGAGDGNIGIGNGNVGMGGPGMHGQNACIVKSVRDSLVAGTPLTLSGIPAGSYTITVLLEDDGGAALEKGTAQIQITDGQTASASITLAPVSQSGGSVSVTINNPVAAKLVVTDAAITAAVSACAAVDIQVQDSNNDPALTLADITFSLSSSATSGAFYSDSACTVAITAADIGVERDGITVYYKDTVAGTPTVTATETSTQGLAAASKVITVQ